MDHRQFRENVVRPTLQYLGMHSEAAENLLIGTAMHESAKLKYIKQINGPALGFFQIEPMTHADVWRYLNTRSDIAAKVRMLASYQYVGEHIPDSELMTNLRYSTAICRIKYWMIPEPIPPADDIEALGRYYKVYYNTKLGKATAQDFVNAYPE